MTNLKKIDKFLIITHVNHVVNEGKYYGYGPYIKEMNVWAKYVNELHILAPIDHIGKISKIDLPYKHEKIIFHEIPNFQITKVKYWFYAFFSTLTIFLKCLKLMGKMDHIHLRCPGNIGLIGSFAQFFFPNKKKTAKYAGNWDWKSKQPTSYRLQQRILRSTLITKNIQVLTYGEWPDRTSNILPFFTASYSINEISNHVKPSIKKCLRLVFIGSLEKYKSPESCLSVCSLLYEKKIPFRFDFYGNGSEFARLEIKIKEYSLENNVFLHGNVGGEEIKSALQHSHFLIFLSKSEGWPKVVAESMFWGCIPITTDVSCISQLVNNGTSGFLVKDDPDQIMFILDSFIMNPLSFNKISSNAMIWSHQYTMEKFEEEIALLL